MLYLLDADEHGPTATRLAPAVLSPAEGTRAASFRRARDRTTYVTAHVALRTVLAVGLGTIPADVPITRAPCPECGAPKGRPMTAGGDLHFSVSHTGSLSLLAFARTPVGVDIEAVPPLSVIGETASVLHPRERAELAALPPHHRRYVFARTWSRREALLKAIGTGLAHAPSRRYVGTAPELGPVDGTWTVRDVTAPEGYAAAVAARICAA